MELKSLPTDSPIRSNEDGQSQKPNKMHLTNVTQGTSGSKELQNTIVIPKSLINFSKEDNREANTQESQKQDPKRDEFLDHLDSGF